MFRDVNSDQNFPEMEKKYLSSWYNSGLVNKYLHKNDSSKKRFSFIDGPITANNPMGVHHAWGRTYKDLWQRFYNLLGHKQRFQNGFDCQGLWVEVEVEKELKLKSKKDIENLVPGDKKASVDKFVTLCKDRVAKYSAIQTDQSKRLGYFMDWDNSYYTMSSENNCMIWHFLKKCFELGWIYKGHESVPWCPRCETAISQHEILTEDYKELTHETVYFELPIKDSDREFLLVWTTTPWTIPANNNVAVDASLDYSLVKGDSGDKFWLATSAVDRVFRNGHRGIERTVKGSELAGLKYTAPFYNLPNVQEVVADNRNFYTVVVTDSFILPISAEEGTGLVHLAGSAGTEDFLLGKKLGLAMVPVIADNADYLPNLGWLAGLNAKNNPRLILDYLQKVDESLGHDWVFEIFNYTHRYPACWRCKAELVWKVADEWYIAMDRKPQEQESTQTLRERMVAIAKAIEWRPEFGKERELEWLGNMHDWLISKKNRYWGLALPIYECKKCGKFEVIGGYEELKARAVSGWSRFEGHTPHKPWIDEVTIKCASCGEEVHRTDDVGNPWLDAGVVPFSTLGYNNNKANWKEWYPADFITESFPGQFKNWFYSLIAVAAVLDNSAPFKTVLGFATLLGENGLPMHKSAGNALEFNEAADKLGVDVMRWMYCRQNPEVDILFGPKKADEVRRQFYLILWNSYKYFIDYANLEHFELYSEPKVTSNILDAWILYRFWETVLDVKSSLTGYLAFGATFELEQFVNDLSTWYIRLSRDRLWVNSDDQEDKESFYNTLFYVLKNLSIALSPLLPFVSEEIYLNLTDQKGKKSVHLEAWPELEPARNSFNCQSKGRIYPEKEIKEKMKQTKTIVEIGRAERKQRSIKSKQPLPYAKVTGITDLTEPFNLLIKQQLNVKEIIWDSETKSESGVKVIFGDVTPDLAIEGVANELMRELQEHRGTAHLLRGDRVRATFLDNLQNKEAVEKFGEEIKKKVLADSLIPGSLTKVEKIT
jgi:isoleucyl-tRNA synthetase